MQCFSCGVAVELSGGERVGFRAACEKCGVDLHVCLNCRHHDPSAYNECRETNAERVGDRDRANRCDYFSPGDGSGAGGPAQSAAKDALDSLFKKN